MGETKQKAKVIKLTSKEKKALTAYVNEFKDARSGLYESKNSYRRTNEKMWEMIGKVRPDLEKNLEDLSFDNAKYEIKGITRKSK